MMDINANPDLLYQAARDAAKGDPVRANMLAPVLHKLAMKPDGLESIKNCIDKNPNLLLDALSAIEVFIPGLIPGMYCTRNPALANALAHVLHRIANPDHRGDAKHGAIKIKEWIDKTPELLNKAGYAATRDHPFMMDALALVVLSSQHIPINEKKTLIDQNPALLFHVKKSARNGNPSMAKALALVSAPDTDERRNYVGGLPAATSMAHR